MSDSPSSGKFLTAPESTDSVGRRMGPDYGMRTRVVLKRVGSGWPDRDRIGLPVPKSEHKRLITMGAGLDEDRVHVTRREVVAEGFQPYAPLAAAKSFCPLRIEMIPASAFGASLHNLLTPVCWKSFRRPAFLAAGYVCEVCGDAGAVEAHEVWTYHAGDRPGWGTQKLERLLCLCRACHEVFHPGLANLRGRLGVVRGRIALINDWHEADLSAWAAIADRDFLRRSRLSWTMDLSNFSAFGPLDIQARWIPNGDGHLATKLPGTGASNAAIRGLNWRIVG